MTEISNNSLGIELFPEFKTLYALISSEVNGLDDAQLDFTSEKWGWSEWSIRMQLSHMASLIPRWLVARWGQETFPDGNHGLGNLTPIVDSPSDRRLDDEVFRDIADIMNMLNKCIGVANRVLSEKPVKFLRERSIRRDPTPQWLSMSRAHPRGVTIEGTPQKGEMAAGTMSLEATFRHIYFEEITHLYNIQRLKKAQGLPSFVDIPKVGYWTLDDWDRSEPN